MSSPIHSLALSAALATLALSYPHAVRQDGGPGLYTLTAYAPDNAQYNGLKVQYGGNLNLFQEKTGSYCPDPPLAQFCPNGTDTVFAGTFYPVSIQALKRKTHLLNIKVLARPRRPRILCRRWRLDAHYSAALALYPSRSLSILFWLELDTVQCVYWILPPLPCE